MKLNLGCGCRRLEGYTNVDLRDSDVNCDIRKLPFPADTAEEIMAIHVAEHFYLIEILPVLREWLRVLKPGGKMVIELPCLDKVLVGFMNGLSDQMTLWALYGDPKTHASGEPALHKWAWSRARFKQLLEKVGLVGVVEEPPQFHQPARDMRWVGFKAPSPLAA